MEPGDIAAVAEPSPSAIGRSIVCFSSNDWTDIPSSKFHIMRHLGQRNTVLYIETLGVRRPTVSSRDARRAYEKLRKIVRGLRHVESNVYVWSPTALPFHGHPLADRINRRLVSASVRRLMRKLGMEQPVVWSYLPNAIDAITDLPADRVVFHCIDDYGEFTDVPREAFEQMETRMLARADLTVVSARRLYETRETRARRIAYIPHGVNFEEFQQRLRDDVALPDVDALPGPIAGFVGRIADWIDVPLMAECARAMPDWSFVFVGPSNIPLDEYASIPNLHFLGARPHELVPQYIKRFDVAVMPFVDNELSASVNPLKMYEYLAVGKPVVTVPMREIGDFADVVRIAEPSEFPAALRAAHAEDSPAARDARLAAVSKRSWGAIAEEILELLDEAPAAGPAEMAA